METRLHESICCNSYRLDCNDLCCRIFTYILRGSNFSWINKVREAQHPIGTHLPRTIRGTKLKSSFNLIYTFPFLSVFRLSSTNGRLTSTGVIFHADDANISGRASANKNPGHFCRIELQCVIIVNFTRRQATYALPILTFSHPVAPKSCQVWDKC